MKEEWRTVVVNGKEHPWYSVSNLGNVCSHLKRNGRGGRGGFYISHDLSYRRPIKQRRMLNKGSLLSLSVSLKFPEDFFEHQYCKSHKSSSNVNKDCLVHQLVMEAFRPMDEYPPDRLKDCWDDIPEEAKIWIKESVIINHIDHDPSNNRVDNLEYVTPRENTRAAKKHYGGNLANKSKQDDDEFMVFTEPKFNVLYQEWEDGRVDFYGEEGEECYNMLIDISKERDISPGEAFWEVIKEGIERERTVS